MLLCANMVEKQANLNKIRGNDAPLRLSRDGVFDGQNYENGILSWEPLLFMTAELPLGVNSVYFSVRSCAVVGP